MHVRSGKRGQASPRRATSGGVGVGREGRGGDGGRCRAGASPTHADGVPPAPRGDATNGRAMRCTNLGGPRGDSDAIERAHAPRSADLWAFERVHLPGQGPGAEVPGCRSLHLQQVRGGAGRCSHFFGTCRVSCAIRGCRCARDRAPRPPSPRSRRFYVNSLLGLDEEALSSAYFKVRWRARTHLHVRTRARFRSRAPPARSPEASAARGRRPRERLHPLPGVGRRFAGCKSGRGGRGGVGAASSLSGSREAADPPLPGAARHRGTRGGGAGRGRESERRRGGEGKGRWRKRGREERGGGEGGAASGDAPRRAAGAPRDAGRAPRLAPPPPPLPPSLGGSASWADLAARPVALLARRPLVVPAPRPSHSRAPSRVSSVRFRRPRPRSRAATRMPACSTCRGASGF